MRTLIIQLPLGAASSSTVYPHAWVQTDAPASAVTLQWAGASLLPAADRLRDVVALIPAQALSWHRVDLPVGLHRQKAKLKAALQGLLEERLLDEPASLHLALAPHGAQTAQPWVTACDRAWLAAHLQTLEMAGLTVHRIVPELTPTEGPLQLTALGDADNGWLWYSQAEQGVWGLPLQAVPPQGEGLWAPGHAPKHTSSEQATEHTSVRAEPAVVDAVSQRLGVPARLMAPGQHWLQALSSDWDLAQFEFQASAQNRRIKRWQRHASQVWQHRDWRPARWGLSLLLVSQLLGLNTWAWKTRANWQAQQQAWTQMLQDTFAQVHVVVDAPLQMAQEVARLQQKSGQLTAHDLQTMLGALGQAMPPDVAAPRQWRYQPGQLQLQDMPLSASAQETIRQALKTQGYQWRVEGSGWLMSLSESAP